MTREEAIRIIETVFQDEYVYKYYDSITHQALDIAIEALKQVTGKLNNPDDSLLTADSEACKEQKSKLDLISRQAATSIPIIPKEHRKVFKGEDDAFETGWNEALACVNMIPSADRPRGEWIDENNSNYANCSECGYQIDTHEERGYHNFCPHCGVDMRGENE